LEVDEANKVFCEEMVGIVGDSAAGVDEQVVLKLVLEPFLNECLFNCFYMFKY